MKRKSVGILGVMLLLMQLAQAQLAESFNTRPGVNTRQLKSYLHNHCWVLNQFEVVPATKRASVKGNGVLVSTSPSGASLHTPYLHITEPLRVSFSFRYSSNFYNHALLNVNLVNAAGEVTTLDVVDLPVNGDHVVLYDEVLQPAINGVYKLALSFRQPDDKGRILLDELLVDAPLYYTGGCNEAPLALSDVYSGHADRSASGNLSANDRNAPAGNLAAFVITPSPDGKISIQDGLQFSFVPKPGFKGNSTQFSYRVCDTGPGNLCSEETWATIRFDPAAGIQPSLLDFSGFYLQDGKIRLGWITSSEITHTLYQVERSTDGIEWKKAGEVQAEKTAATAVKYVFEDRVSTNTANKKDLFYRLKQIRDNRVFVSRLLVLRVYNTQTLKMVSVTPNPVKNDIGIRIELNQDALVALRVINHAGTVQMRRNMRAGAGMNTYLMNGTSALLPGIYFLEIVVNSKERMLVSLVKE